MSREQKLDIVHRFSSVSGITCDASWKSITPDKHNDWVDQRDESFGTLPEIYSSASTGIFSVKTSGLQTNRDTWCQNGCKSSLLKNVKRLIKTYAADLKKISESCEDEIESLITTDESKIKWTRGLLRSAANNETVKLDKSCVRQTLYRPFFKQWLYFDKTLNEYTNKFPNIFPSQSHPNKVIVVSGKSNKGFSVLITDVIADVQLVFNDHCFPLFTYDTELTGTGLFDSHDSKSKATNTIGDFSLAQFQQAYHENGDSITKEGLFYYIYGLLHSPEYRERYKDNLSKELPRIPAVKKFEDFQAFSQAGRDLAHWHLDYETVDCYPVNVILPDEINARSRDIGAPDPKPENWSLIDQLRRQSPLTDEHFYVRKMKFPTANDEATKKSVKDRTAIVYNEYISIFGIPLEAYDYVVNGKSAIEWVMERQSVREDKKSGIINDANLWATETMNNAAYPLELLMRVITVSLETMQIVNSLPKLEID